MFYTAHVLGHTDNYGLGIPAFPKTWAGTDTHYSAFEFILPTYEEFFTDLFLAPTIQPEDYTW